MAYGNVMIMGAGAVGGYFGGRIAQHTVAKVTLITRGAHLDAIQTNGLQIKSPDEDVVISVNALDDPGKAKPPDLIFFTVKSYDTEQAIEQIMPVVKKDSQIITIQNGIENHPKLVEAFGAHRVIQGFCKVGAEIIEPGVIAHEAFGEITAGETDGSISTRLKMLQALCDEAKIPLHITPEIARKVWLKFAWNCIFNMITAVADVTVEKLFKSTETEQLCYDLFDEIRRVAETENVKLTEADAKKIIEPACELEGFKTSTYQDRQKAKKLEYEAFTGAIVRLADENGLDVPRYRTLHALLKMVDNP